MLVENYRGWNIYYYHSPRSLWAATKGVEKVIHSHEGLEAIRGDIDKKEDKR